MPTTPYSVTESAWLQIGTAPCAVECKSVQPTCLYVGTTMPSLSETGFTVLRNDDPDGFAVTAPGNNVYARAFNQQSNGAVYPIAAAGSAGGGGGGGDASAANQQAQIAALGAPTDPATASGSNSTIVGALRAIRDKILGTLTTTPAQPDNAVTTYALTAAGPQTGIRNTGYGSIQVELTGTFSATVALQGSSDSTDGVDGTWTTLLGTNPEDASTVAPTIGLSTARRRLRFSATDPWVRLNTTVFGSGPVNARIVQRVVPIAPGSIFIGNTVLTAGAVVFSEAFRASLAASAVVTGQLRDITITPAYSRFGATVVTDQAGSLQVQMSIDGANWLNSATQAVTANVPVDVSVPVRARFYRAVYTNGATATGANAFSLLTSYTAA